MKCDEKTCPGHLGKFSDCLSEALYEWSLDGSSEEASTGDVEYQGYVSLFILTEDDTVHLDLSRADSRTITVPTGNYILHQANSGIVSLFKFETEEDARDEFAVYEQAYGIWVDED